MELTPEPASRRKEIVEAAARLFCQRGYQHTSVRDLAEAVGMQSGSLFYYFKSKEELLVAVMEEGIRRAEAGVEQALALARTPRERLRSLFAGHLEALLGEAREPMAVLLYEWQNLSAGAQARVVELRDAYERRWQVVLDEAAAAGLIPRDTRLWRRYVLGALNWTSVWYRSGGELGVRELADRFLGFALKDGEEA